MFDPTESVAEPDLLETAEEYRDHLIAELERIEAFLTLGKELAGTGNWTDADAQFAGMSSPSRRLH